MKVFLIHLVFLTIICVSCMDNKQVTIHKDLDAIEAKVAKIIEIYQDETYQSKINSLVSENYIRNMNGIEMVSNRTELKALLELYFVGFPDINISQKVSRVCNNEAYITWTMTGTNTGIFSEAIATGKKVKISGCSHLYFNKNGKLEQEDVFYNELYFLQQLGYTLTPPILK